MSWAEIKKAVNNDLDTPLNELITSSRGSNNYTWYGISSTTTSLTTVIDISGSGYLAYLYCVGTSTYPPIVKITIDGDVYLYAQGTYESSSSSSYFFILNTLPYGYTATTTAPNVYTTGNNQVSGTLTLPNEEEQTLLRLNLPFPIRFESSLMIEARYYTASTSSSGRYFQCAYTLD